MFPEIWRRRWGLQEAPFLHEDADHDPLLDRLDRWAVHDAFDRLHDGTRPGPFALVFGAAGSGKSALRRSLGSAARGPRGPLVVELTELDPWLSVHRNRAGARPPRPEDSLDLLVSQVATELLERIHEEPLRLRPLPRRQRGRLAALLCLYAADPDGDREQRLRSVRVRRPGRSVQAALGLACAAAALSPLAGLNGLLPLGLTEGVLPLAGGAGLLGLSVLAALRSPLQRRRAHWLTKQVLVVPRDVPRLSSALAAAHRKDRRLLQGKGPLEARHSALEEFIALARVLGWSGARVLVDRVDEAHGLGGDREAMRAWVQPLTAGRLAELDGLTLQFFLPLELRPYVQPRGAARSFPKTGRIEELRWSGQQLLELADRRLAAAARGPAPSLTHLVGENIHEAELRDTLDVLGTPRLAFGFLRELFEAHVRDLPGSLPAEPAAWAVRRTTFEIHRAAWSDRAANLRRGQSVRAVGGTARQGV